MLVVILLFLILVVWGLIDGELYWRDALLVGVPFFGSFVLMFVKPQWIIGLIVVPVLIVIYLLLKLLGRDVTI